jgi:hypothetical protein
MNLKADLKFFKVVAPDINIPFGQAETDCHEVPKSQSKIFGRHFRFMAERELP